MDRKINGHSATFIKRQARNIKKEQNITHREALDVAAINAGFTGWDNFINKSKQSSNQKAIKKDPPKLPSPLVLSYHPIFVKHARKRPNAKMPVKAHLELGGILKELVIATEDHSRARNAIGFVRGTLDDWAQYEYTDHKELSNEVFFKMYYGEPIVIGQDSPSLERQQQLITLCQKAIGFLKKHYHDCPPRRELTEKLQLAINWIKKWPNKKKPQRVYRSRTAILPGTLVYAKSKNRPAIVISHDTWNGTVNCYGNSGPFLRARQEIVVPKEQSPKSSFKPLRLWLPYGKWKFEDGTELLFNRDYRPLWARRKDGKVIPVDPHATVQNNGGGEYFFNDGSTPWGGNKNSLNACISILREWGVEDQIPGTLKLLPEAIATGSTDILKYANTEKVFA